MEDLGGDMAGALNVSGACTQLGQEDVVVLCEA
jgi:hypothetical protein